MRSLLLPPIFGGYWNRENFGHQKITHCRLGALKLSISAQFAIFSLYLGLLHLSWPFTFKDLALGAGHKFRVARGLEFEDAVGNLLVEFQV